MSLPATTPKDRYSIRTHTPDTSQFASPARCKWGSGLGKVYGCIRVPGHLGEHTFDEPTWECLAEINEHTLYSAECYWCQEEIASGSQKSEVAERLADHIRDVHPEVTA